MSGGALLAEYIRTHRKQRGWTQKELSAVTRLSIDTVRRLESGSYVLSERPREGGGSIDLLARALGKSVCEIVTFCFSEDEIRKSAYVRCLEPEAATSAPHMERISLREYVDELPRGRNALLVHGSVFNAHAMAFVINLEREFDRFEFLVTNQPPFMLFADEEYVMTGSASTELAEPDRHVYHTLIFEHQATLREQVRRGIKHYKVVLHKQSLIEFLGARSRERAERIVREVTSMLRYPGFDLVILEAPDPLDEFEVLSGSYPFRHGVDNDSVSIQHRRIGVDNTLVYQPAVIGARSELVTQDYIRAEALWRKGMQQCEGYPLEYAEYHSVNLPTMRKRIVARLLADALASAHAR